VLGFVGRARTRSGTSLAGIITGSIAIVLSLGLIALIVAGVGFMAMNAPPAAPNNPQVRPWQPPPPPPAPKFNNPRKP
jgi:hypothetical protein